jgi:DNA-binding response OmpR family regulator
MDMAFVLIVDDDEDFATAAATVLRDAGHEVSIELDPQSGFKSIETRRPDLVVLDVMFPENYTAGFDLARTISRKFKETPILMLTALNQISPLGFSQRDIDEVWLPIADFVEKPLDLEVLSKRVSDLLRPKAREMEERG